MKTFPKPLTRAEEMNYLIAFKNGDMGAKRILIEKNMRLVAHMVKKYSYPEDQFEDLIQTGTIGLIKAVNSFDCEKGNRFATYAAKCIENEILMVFRNNKKSSRDVSLYGPIGVDKEGNEINLLDVFETFDEDIVEKISRNDTVLKLKEEMKKVLTKRERMIIEMRYGLRDGVEITQREVASTLNISRSYVSRIEKRAIKKLELAIKGENRKTQQKNCKTD